MPHPCNVLIVSPCSPSKHVSHTITKCKAVRYEGHYGEPRFGTIVEDNDLYIVLKEHRTNEEHRIYTRYIKEIYNVQIVHTITDTTDNTFYNSKGLKRLTTHCYYAVSAEKKIKVDFVNFAHTEIKPFLKYSV